MRGSGARQWPHLCAPRTPEGAEGNLVAVELDGPETLRPDIVGRAAMFPGECPGLHGYLPFGVGARSFTSMLPLKRCAVHPAAPGRPPRPTLGRSAARFKRPHHIQEADRQTMKLHRHSERGNPTLLRFHSDTLCLPRRPATFWPVPRWTAPRPSTACKRAMTAKVVLVPAVMSARAVCRDGLHYFAHVRTAWVTSVELTSRYHRFSSRRGYGEEAGRPPGPSGPPTCRGGRAGPHLVG